MQFPNLPLGDCQPGVQPVYPFSEPTSSGLSTRGFGLFMQSMNLPPGDCLPGIEPAYAVYTLPPVYCRPAVQPVYAVYDVPPRELLDRSAGC